MLDGGWKESGCSVIELELSDPNITKSSLNTVFGAFYRDTILLSETISKQYNLPHLLKSTVKWLADNLLIMSDCASTYDFLRKIP
ncbi:hypothetical protein X801_04876 [Opisthorchis viverrini]|uniref:Uncharacterized protein n=2 Tax=Opisthorchis viverrini TaxID=6198 RepID=A0A075ACS6_OPIVI|nr:hypothetical protein T265_06959 [Opisthorchis viverrini]KER25604.1 hypothetical protein T265_06959 [Opisthorchis viverrini]OON19258.1 hypothetical protein X801_04876 [Opisthorchis viverrini]